MKWYIRAFVLVLIFPCHFPLFAQFSIGPKVGITTSDGWSKTDPIYFIREYDSTGYTKPKLLLGMFAQIALSKHLSIGLDARATKIILPYGDRGVVGYTDMKFTRYISSASISWRPVRFFSSGIGFLWTYSTGFTQGKEHRDIWSSAYKGEQVHHFGYRPFVKLYVSKFFIEGSCRLEDFHKRFLFDDFYITKSFDINLGYQFDFRTKSKRPKKGSVVCPTF